MTELWHVGSEGLATVQNLQNHRSDPSTSSVWVVCPCPVCILSAPHTDLLLGELAAVASNLCELPAVDTLFVITVDLLVAR